MREQNHIEKTFQQNFNRLFKESGRTQAELANYVGCSISAISLYATGRRMPRLDVVNKIAEFLMVSRESLFGKNVDLSELEVHDLLDELFHDNPPVLRAIRKIRVDGSISDGIGRYKLSESSKMFIKNTILLALKEAKENAGK